MQTIKAAVAERRVSRPVAAPPAGRGTLLDQVVEGPPEGAGWLGYGKPWSVGLGSRERPFADGGGLCSPGRWAPGSRRHPWGANEWLWAQIRGSLIAMEKVQGGTWKRILAEAMSGNLRAQPFGESPLKVAQAFRAHLAHLGFPVPPDLSDHPMLNKMGFLLFGTALQAAGDPD